MEAGRCSEADLRRLEPRILRLLLIHWKSHPRTSTTASSWPRLVLPWRQPTFDGVPRSKTKCTRRDWHTPRHSRGPAWRRWSPCDRHLRVYEEHPDPPRERSRTWAHRNGDDCCQLCLHPCSRVQGHWGPPEWPLSRVLEVERCVSIPIDAAVDEEEDDEDDAGNQRDAWIRVSGRLGTNGGRQEGQKD